jgi:hypothetical protein
MVTALVQIYVSVMRVIEVSAMNPTNVPLFVMISVSMLYAQPLVYVPVSKDTGNQVPTYVHQFVILHV